MGVKTIDGRWQKVRLRIMARDYWSCVSCGMSADDGCELNVHHKYYMGPDLWAVPDVGLQTLCRECHEGLGRHPSGGVWYEVGGCSVVVMHCQVCGCGDVEIIGDGRAYLCAGCGAETAFVWSIKRPWEEVAYAHPKVPVAHMENMPLGSTSCGCGECEKARKRKEAV